MKPFESKGCIKQKRVTDYFTAQPPWYKRWSPKTILDIDGYPYLFATIMDLPNELLLSVLDYMRLENHLGGHARNLALVCRRFHQVFAPLALEIVQCHGVTRIRYFKDLVLNSVNFPRNTIKVAVFSYKKCDEISMQAVSKQLVPIVQKLRMITTIVLTGVVVNFELLVALGTLLHLTSLTYDAPYPYDTLIRVSRYGVFDPRHLKQHLHLLPKKLKEISFTLSCSDTEGHAIQFFLCIISASESSLTSLTVDLRSMEGGVSLKGLLKMQLPSLSSLTIYYLGFDWPYFRDFCSRHSPHLQHVEVYFHIDFVHHDELLRIADIPGIEDSSSEHRLEVVAMVMRAEGVSKPSVKELALEQCSWSILKYIGQAHPAIRVLNAWNSPVDDEDICELIAAGHYFLNLEVLRFNTDERGLGHNTISKPFPFCPVCVTSKCNINHPFLENSDHNGDPVQRVLDWEQDEGPIYQETVRQLIDNFPKLRLVEWFLLPLEWSRRDGVFIPYWSWKIQQTAQNGRPAIFRSLHDVNIRPFDPLSTFNLTRGFSAPG